MRQLMAFEALGCPEVLPLKTEYQPMIDEADVASLEINWNEKCAAASRVARGAEELRATEARLEGGQSLRALIANLPRGERRERRRGEERRT